MTTVLHGIRVLDFSRVFAGPAATQVLGDLGADVIKVEEPGRGDEARYFGVTEDSLREVRRRQPVVRRAQPQQAQHHASISPRPPAARPRGAMAANCDVVVHNFRPGAMQRWGLGYDALRAINPGRHLLRLLRVRQAGTAVAHRRQRPRAAGAQRPHEHHRRARSAAGALSARRSIDLHASLALVTGDPRRVVPSRAHRRGTGRRDLAAAQLGASGELFLRRVLVGGHHPQADGHRQSPERPEPGVSDRRRQRGDHRAERRDVAAVRRSRWTPSARPPRVDDHAATGSGSASEVVAAISAVTRTMTSARAGRAARRREGQCRQGANIGEAADHAQLAEIGGVVEFEMDGRR